LDFITWYLASGNATASYREVYGCTPAAATAAAARLLADPRAKEMVERHRAEANERAGLNATWFAERVKREAEGYGEDFTHAGRVAALRLAGMMLGLFKERHEHEHSGPGGAAIPVDLKKLSDADLDALTAIFERAQVAHAGPGELNAEPEQPT
jgi:hypothetical protein